jgi:hypothetical protein
MLLRLGQWMNMGLLLRQYQYRNGCARKGTATKKNTSDLMMMFQSVSKMKYDKTAPIRKNNIPIGVVPL